MRDASQIERDVLQCKMSTVLIAEGAVIFQDKLAVQLDVPVLAHPVDRRQAVMLKLRCNPLPLVACCPDLVVPSLM